MIKKRRVKFGKMYVAGAIILALGVMGTSYAVWTREHLVTAKLSTDKFDFKLGEAGHAARIVDLQGNYVELLDFSFNGIDNMKNAEFTFNSGIPSELLEEGRYLQITFPIEPTDSDDKTRLFEYEVDFSRDEALVFHAKGGYLSFDQTVYEYANLPAEFLQDISFHVYRSVEIKDDTYYGSVYLELTDESRELLTALPTELTLDTKVEELTVSDKKSEYDGVMVEYDAQISFHLEQFNKQANK